MPVIQGPKLTATRFGLIPSAKIVVDGSDVEPNPLDTGGAGSGDRWVQGISWRSEDCDHGEALQACQGSTTDAATQGTNVDPHYPFYIAANVSCSTFGNVISAEDEARAYRKLLAIQSYRLEAEFWSGTVAQAAGWTHNQYLTGSNPTLIEGGNPLGTLTGLAEAEQWLARNTNERGMIHASPRTVSYWLSTHDVWQDTASGLLVTSQGTLVVAGAGYEPTHGPSTAPNSGAMGGVTPADRGWVFLTPLVYVRLGEVFAQAREDSQQVDRAANRRLVRAYRAASANFTPCGVAAMLIDHTHERTTTGS